MPQLDVTIFLPQIFWLAATFLVLYLLVILHINPKIARIVKFRDKVKKNPGIYAGQYKRSEEFRWKTIADGDRVSALARYRIQSMKDIEADYILHEKRQEKISRGLRRRFEALEARRAIEDRK